ncbi:MAG: type II secretion system protein [Lachnospiraceae bacterium]|nr:type II secretion system protein [Lachnospiraceae bacterium]
MIKQTKKKGFTIVELVIVIAVVAILAAVLIPTFASLIEKANESVDMQIVKQMNTVLQAEEIVDGKPATVVTAKDILAANGCDDFTPTDATNVYYWVGSENRVLLWNTEETKVTYPKEQAKKHEGVTEPSVDWSDLADDYSAEVIVPAEGQTLEEALLAALADADTGEEIFFTLPANSELSLSQNQNIVFSNALATAAGVGKNISIDMNGSSLNVLSVYGIDIPDGATLELINGTYNYGDQENYYDSVFEVQVGSSLILRDMKMNLQANTGIAPLGNASEVIISGCDISIDAYYGIMTNGLTSDAVRLVINDSTIKNTVNGGGIGILVNCDSNVHIKDSDIIGSCHALIMRAGHAEVIDSTLETIAKTADGFLYTDFKGGYVRTPDIEGVPVEGVTILSWGEGNRVPGGVLVLGDYSNKVTNYPGDVDCELQNVAFKSSNITEIPNVLLGARYGKNVTLSYGEDSNVGDVTLYEMVKGWFGSIIVNGETKTID